MISHSLNGLFSQIAQKCNKKLHEKKVPPLSPLTFQRAAGPLVNESCNVKAIDESLNGKNVSESCKVKVIE